MRPGLSVLTLQVRVFLGTLPDPKRRAIVTGQAYPTCVCVRPEEKSGAVRNPGLERRWSV